MDWGRLVIYLLVAALGFLCIAAQDEDQNEIFKQISEELDKIEKALGRLLELIHSSAPITTSPTPPPTPPPTPTPTPPPTSPPPLPPATEAPVSSSVPTPTETPSPGMTSSNTEADGTEDTLSTAILVISDTDETLATSEATATSPTGTDDGPVSSIPVGPSTTPVPTTEVSGTDLSASDQDQVDPTSTIETPLPSEEGGRETPSEESYESSEETIVTGDVDFTGDESSNDGSSNASNDGSTGDSSSNASNDDSTGGGSSNVSNESFTEDPTESDNFNDQTTSQPNFSDKPETEEKTLVSEDEEKPDDEERPLVSENEEGNTDEKDTNTNDDTNPRAADSGTTDAIEFPLPEVSPEATQSSLTIEAESEYVFVETLRPIHISDRIPDRLIDFTRNASSNEMNSETSDEEKNIEEGEDKGDSEEGNKDGVKEGVVREKSEETNVSAEEHKVLSLEHWSVSEEKELEINEGERESKHQDDEDDDDDVKEEGIGESSSERISSRSEEERNSDEKITSKERVEEIEDENSDYSSEKSNDVGEGNEKDEGINESRKLGKENDSDFNSTSDEGKEDDAFTEGDETAFYSNESDGNEGNTKNNEADDIQFENDSGDSKNKSDEVVDEYTLDDEYEYDSYEDEHRDVVYDDDVYYHLDSEFDHNFSAALRGFSDASINGEITYEKSTEEVSLESFNSRENVMESKGNPEDSSEHGGEEDKSKSKEEVRGTDSRSEEESKSISEEAKNEQSEDSNEAKKNKAGKKDKKRRRRRRRRMRRRRNKRSADEYQDICVTGIFVDGKDLCKRLQTILKEISDVTRRVDIESATGDQLRTLRENRESLEEVVAEVKKDPSIIRSFNQSSLMLGIGGLQTQIMFMNAFLTEVDVEASDLTLVIYVVAGGAVILIAMLILCCYVCCKLSSIRKKKKKHSVENMESVVVQTGARRLSISGRDNPAFTHMDTIPLRGGRFSAPLEGVPGPGESCGIPRPRYTMEISYDLNGRHHHDSYSLPRDRRSLQKFKSAYDSGYSEDRRSLSDYGSVRRNLDEADPSFRDQEAKGHSKGHGGKRSPQPPNDFADDRNDPYSLERGEDAVRRISTGRLRRIDP